MELKAVGGKSNSFAQGANDGLWDWDLARGRVFWSHSMFAILGFIFYPPSPRNVTREQVAGLMEALRGYDATRIPLGNDASPAKS